MLVVGTLNITRYVPAELLEGIKSCLAFPETMSKPWGEEAYNMYGYKGPFNLGKLLRLEGIHEVYVDPNKEYPKAEDPRLKDIYSKSYYVISATVDREFDPSTWWETSVGPAKEVKIPEPRGTFNEKVGVDIFPANVIQVTVVQDCCTDSLQSMLDRGYRILAVCPQPDQRRPDYVLGITKKEEQN